MNFISYHGDLFRKQKLILPSDDGAKKTQMLSKYLLRAVHYFATHYSPQGGMNVNDIDPKAVVELAKAFADADKVLAKAREKREQS
jgi:hypothetical protein